MFQVDAATMDALMSGVAEMTFKVTCVSPITGVTDILVVEDQVGVQSTNQSQVTRTATFVVTRDVIAAGLLSSLTDHVYVRCGVRGLADIPLFYGRVSTQEENEQGHVIVTCMGQINDVVNDDFPTPWATSGAAAYQEMALIIHDVDASISVTVDSGVTPVVPPTQAFQDNRGQALDTLVKMMSAKYQDARAGGVHIYLDPFGIPNPPGTGIVLSDGINGTLVQVTHNSSRESIYNSITLTTQPLANADGTQGVPLTVTVVDNDPTSLTYFYGPFGKRNKNYSLQTSLDGVSLRLLALQILRQSLALAETWTITSPFMPILDPDDVFGVTFNGITAQLVVESVQHNGVATTTTSITARKLQLLSAVDSVQ